MRLHPAAFAGHMGSSVRLFPFSPDVPACQTVAWLLLACPPTKHEAMLGKHPPAAAHAFWAAWLIAWPFLRLGKSAAFPGAAFLSDIDHTP